jgi:AraC-like DNA-binding protein
VIGVLGALVLERENRARLEGSLRGRMHVRFCHRRDELLAIAGDADTTALVTETRDSDGEPLAPVIARLRSRAPTVPVIAYIRHPQTSPRDILDVARAGVHELVRAGFDDVGFVLQAALRSASCGATAAVVWKEITHLIPTDARTIVSFIIERADRDLSIGALAKGLGVDRRTIVRRLTAAHLPGPRRLVGWCRLLMAARLLEEERRSVEAVALALDFPSAGALRNLLWRYTGLRPRELRENGGLRCVLHQFRLELARTDRCDTPSAIDEGHMLGD